MNNKQINLGNMDQLKPDMNKPGTNKILITLGDHAGSGIDIFLKSLDMIPQNAIVLGCLEQVNQRAKILEIPFPTPELFGVENVSDNWLFWDIPFKQMLTIGQPNAHTGRHSFLCLELATKWILNNDLTSILVNLPIQKSAWQAAGLHYPGHTEALAELSGISNDEIKMAFYLAPEYKKRIVLQTIHIPLAMVPQAISGEKICQSIRILKKDGSGCIAILGLNPHAGEEGMLGNQELEWQKALAAEFVYGVDYEGPFPADTFFVYPWKSGKYDQVLAMYHDQGLIAAKILSQGQSMNATLGLPFIRLSVDHGTALDKAGTGDINPLGFQNILNYITQKR